MKGRCALPGVPAMQGTAGAGGGRGGQRPRQGCAPLSARTRRTGHAAWLCAAKCATFVRKHDGTKAASNRML